MSYFFNTGLLILALLLSGRSTAQRLWQFNKDTVITWYYADGDEFEQDTLDTGKWSYWYGWSRSIFSQKEQEYYTDGKNLELKNGYLNLFAVKEDTTARMVDWLPDSDSMILDGRFYGLNKQLFHYTAGMIQSRKRYKYGYFEMRFRIPEEKGYWPAFWLYGGTPNEEIDWMELKTEKKNAIHVGRHSQKKEENKMRNVFRKKWWGDWVYFKGDLSKGYHVIAGEWTPEYVRYFLNGECIAYSKVPLHEEKVMCANIAVPGKDGSFHPAPDPEIKRSGNFTIDYIRVWTSDQGSAKPFPEMTLKKTNDTLAITKLKSKTKFLYGKRADHENEGFTLSLIPYGHGVYNLQALGKDIPANAHFFVSHGDVISPQALKYGANLLSIPKGQQKATLTVECYGRKLTYNILP